MSDRLNARVPKPRPNYQSVLTRIKECQARGLSQKATAEEMGISAESVFYYLNRDRMLELRKIRHSKSMLRSKTGPSCDESDKDIFETDVMARRFAEAIATQAPGRY